MRKPPESIPGGFNCLSVYGSEYSPSGVPTPP